MAEGDTEIERILVALDSALRDDALLEAAARLAALADAELTALFVEDTELLQLAALPFACELDRASAALRAIAPESVEREMQAQARRLRSCVESLRAKHGIRASLRVVRGEFATTALAEAGGRDILFISVGAQVRESPRVRGAEGGREMRRFDVPGHSPVCVYFDNTPPAPRALRLARDWARQWGRRLWILAAPDDAAARAAREAGVADAEIIGLADRGERSLREALARSRCALLVLPRGRDGAGLRRGGLLDAVSCPVVLVS